MKFCDFISIGQMTLYNTSVLQIVNLSRLHVFLKATIIML